MKSSDGYLKAFDLRYFYVFFYFPLTIFSEILHKMSPGSLMLLNFNLDKLNRYNFISTRRKNDPKPDFFYLLSIFSHTSFVFKYVI